MQPKERYQDSEQIWAINVSAAVQQRRKDEGLRERERGEDFSQNIYSVATKIQLGDLTEIGSAKSCLQLRLKSEKDRML